MHLLKSVHLLSVNPSNLVNISCRRNAGIWLNLSGGCRTDIVVTKLAHTLKRNLRGISLAWNTRITDLSLSELVNLCPQLEVMDVTACSVSTTGLAYVASKCRQLRCLRFGFHPGMTMQGVVDVMMDWDKGPVKGNPDARWLVMQGMTKTCTQWLEKEAIKLKMNLAFSVEEVSHVGAKMPWEG